MPSRIIEIREFINDSDLIPTVAMFATYATYTVIMKEELSCSSCSW